MTAIYKKEIRSYFNSPIGYVIIAAFLVISGYYFAMMLFSSLSFMSYVFNNMIMVFMFVIPLLTMRLIAEEKNTKTDQLLFTAPITIKSIVAGKMLAAITVFAIAVLFTVLYPIILSIFVPVQWSEIIANYKGFILLGSAYISIGVFISSLTENQIISAVCSFVLFLLLFLTEMFSVNVKNEILLTIIGWISISGRYTDFSVGIINVADVIYYLSIIGVFGFLTVRHLENRRWSK